MYNHEFSTSSDLTIYEFTLTIQSILPNEQSSFLPIIIQI
ncbi:hypothetical protein KP78_13570 [Jeotgalibacillus soli]|uniref:Uncharacterized protein n=1 Tax=Jeotgalibacillus soli TaxID=889306 RepID=A0A0C2S791_9BACL|nr:hypothetical protein KP78_13570 [Jeotgalibacillus soli]